MGTNNVPLPALAASTAAQASGQANVQTQQNNPLELLATLIKSGSIPEGTALTTKQTQMPQVLPLVPQAHPQMQMDDREFATGTGNARVARNNVFRNLSTIVNTASQQREAKQVRTLQNDITRMFGAMEGLNQAQASGDKDAVAHNKQIIADILGDPKKAKQIEKAFDINLLGDQKNPTETKALMQAYGAWQKGGRQGENPVAARATANLQRSMPQVQGMNPALIAALQIGKMNKDAGGITDKDKLDNYTKVATTQMVTDAHKFASQMSYYGRIDEETTRGINEMNKTLLQNMGKADKESLDATEKTVKNTNEMLSKSIEAKQKAIDKLGTTLPFTQAGKQKEQLQQDLQGLIKLKNQTESYQLLIQKRRVGDANAGTSSSSAAGNGTGSTVDTKPSTTTSRGTTKDSGENLGVPAAIFDEFYKQFWSNWGFGKNNDDSYAGKTGS